MPTKPKPPKTPECDKLSSVKDRSQPIGEFLEWLGERGINLCSILHEAHGKGCTPEKCVTHEQYIPVSRIQRVPETKEEGVALKLMGVTKIVQFRTTEERLAAYFGIDLDLVEQERREILDYLRKTQAVKA